MAGAACVVVMATTVPPEGWPPRRCDYVLVDRGLRIVPGRRPQPIGVIWPDGMVRAGNASGATMTSTPSVSRTSAVPYVTNRRHGRVFSIAVRPATTAIHDTLMTPSA